MATATMEKYREELTSASAAASEAYAKFDKMRTEMVKEGIDLLTDHDNFAKLDTARKEYSTLAQTAAGYELRIGEIAAMDGLGNGRRDGTSLPYPGRVTQVDAFEHEYGIGAALLRSEGYQAVRNSGALGRDNGPVPDIPAVEIVERQGLKAILRSGVNGFGAVTPIAGGGAGTNTGVGPFIAFDLKPGYIELLRKTPTLAGMVGEGTTDSDTIEYVSQASRTNAAVETAETTVAPESAAAYTLNTVNVREIPHWLATTRRAMADYGQVTTLINNELVNGVLDRVDTQIATGAGGGVLFTGIYNTSGISTQPLGGDTRADAIHKAITQIEVAFLQADYVGMHPNDWQKLRLEKDADGQYLLGPAGMSGDKVIWGVPVVTSQAFTSGTPMVGAYKRSATLWLREGVTVSSGLDGNDFTNRRMTMLATIRAGFAVQRVAGFCSVAGF